MKKFSLWMLASISCGSIGFWLMMAAFEIGYYVGDGPHHNSFKAFLWWVGMAAIPVAGAFIAGRYSRKEEISGLTRDVNSLETLRRHLMDELRNEEGMSWCKGHENMLIREAVKDLEQENARLQQELASFQKSHTPPPIPLTAKLPKPSSKTLVGMAVKKGN